MATGAMILFILGMAVRFVQADTQPDKKYGDLQKWLFRDGKKVRLTAEWNEQGSPWEKYGGYHTGIDYSAPEGTTAVYSATDGKVIEVRHGTDPPNSSLSLVAIYHKDTNVTFFYLHIKGIKIRKGDIKAGEQIGVVGQRGDVTGPHLHFEARPGEQHYAADHVKKTTPPYEVAKKARGIVFKEQGKKFQQESVFYPRQDIRIVEQYLVLGKESQLRIAYRNITKRTLRIYFKVSWFYDPEKTGSWKWFAQLDERGPIPPDGKEELVYTNLPKFSPQHITRYMIQMGIYEWDDDVWESWKGEQFSFSRKLPYVWFDPGFSPIVKPSRIIETSVGR